MQLRTSLYSIVLGLFLLVLLAVGLGWYGQAQVETALASSGAGAAAAQAVSSQLSGYVYLFIAILVVGVVLALWGLVFVNRQVVQPLQEAVEHFEHLASGDLSERIDFESSNEVGALYDALRHLQENVSRMVLTVRSGMQEIAQGSDRIFQGNTDLSSRTEQQAAALQQTASSLEQLSSTVKQNADNAQQANQMATTASDVAQRGGQAVGEVVSTMQGISASSSKISDIVGVIDSIAFQTNILALNAAVEAARAGEQGKGFAVVASEVRALAQRSASAAKEIKDLIEDSVKKVAEGSNQVERAGSTMHDIVESVAKVTDIMGEISAATREQAAGIDQINRAVSQMDLVTQQNAALVEQSADSASSLRDRAGHVAEIVASFKVSNRQVIDLPEHAGNASQSARSLASNPGAHTGAAALTSSARSEGHHGGASVTAVSHKAAPRVASSQLKAAPPAAATSHSRTGAVAPAHKVLTAGGHSKPATAAAPVSSSGSASSTRSSSGTARPVAPAAAGAARPAASASAAKAKPAPANPVAPPSGNEPLLRPDLSASGARSKRSSAADDDWEEF